MSLLSHELHILQPLSFEKLWTIMIEHKVSLLPKMLPDLIAQCNKLLSVIKTEINQIHYQLKFQAKWRFRSTSY